MDNALLLIAGMTLVTYIPRVLPLMTLSSRELAPGFLQWLQMIPPAVLAALLAPELILNKTNSTYSFFISMNNQLLLAAIPTFLVSWFTRNFFITIATGMLAVALLRYIAA